MENTPNTLMFHKDYLKKFENGFTNSFQEEILKNELKTVAAILQKQIFSKKKIKIKEFLNQDDSSCKIF